MFGKKNKHNAATILKPGLLILVVIAIILIFRFYTGKNQGVYPAVWCAGPCDIYCHLFIAGGDTCAACGCHVSGRGPGLWQVVGDIVYPDRCDTGFRFFISHCPVSGAGNDRETGCAEKRTPQVL